MNITKVSYNALFNLGDYNKEKLGFTADLEPGESPEDAIAALREKAIATATTRGLGAECDIHSRIFRKRSELLNIENKIKKAQEEWNQVAEFLRTQGIKPDAPNFTLKALTPAVDEKTVIDGELDDGF